MFNLMLLDLDKDGYYHRTELNKRIYRIGKGNNEDNATTQVDVNKKNISPMGFFAHYVIVQNDYLIVKGCTIGIRKITFILRKGVFAKIESDETV